MWLVSTNRMIAIIMRNKKIMKTNLESAQKTNKGSTTSPEKVAADKADDDANAVHPPFVPLGLWLPFEGIP
jgi:hypothetical protein